MVFYCLCSADGNKYCKFINPFVKGLVMKLNKVYAALFISLAVMAGSAHADAIGAVADAAKSIFGGSKVNTDVTIGTFTNGSNVDAKAEAQGRGSKAMAGGVVATSGGSGAAVNTKVTLGVFDNSSVKAKAKAGDGAEAYAGGVISASKDK